MSSPFLDTVYIYSYTTLQAGITNNMLQILSSSLRIVLSKKETGRNSGYQWGLEDKSISISPNYANLPTLRFIFFPLFFSFPGQLIGLIINRALFRDSFILRPKSIFWVIRMKGPKWLFLHYSTYSVSFKLPTILI